LAKYRLNWAGYISAVERSLVIRQHRIAWLIGCRQLTRLEQKMSADVYMILEVLRQQQQQQHQYQAAAGLLPRVSDMAVNTVPYCDTAGGAMLDTVL